MLNVLLTSESVSLINIFKNIGLGGWFIVTVILILSLISVYIFIERIIAINKASKRKNSFINHIKDFIYESKLDSAIDLCHSTNSPISRMIEKGLLRMGNSLDDISSSIENVGKLEIYKLENKLSTLASISGAAPMLGFLGTVMGMVSAFFEVEQRGSMDIQVLASGIYTAMITTVLGLIVGIIAYLAYNYLSAKVQQVVHLMESDIISFLDLLHDKEKKMNSKSKTISTESSEEKISFEHVSNQQKSGDLNEGNSQSINNQDNFN
ncbi:MAG: hypothetical protein CBC73_01725 [Flavobacteriales bacterium TMED113]|nr:MAG: hypothetical protein CBC73_01725 [Flavobacteriales bacterium TMED113]|tara:strand:+ start:174 stop:971 length:798 start_codon:yes stop_codon:yes gene_type:complete